MNVKINWRKIFFGLKFFIHLCEKCFGGKTFFENRIQYVMTETLRLATF